MDITELNETYGKIKKDIEGRIKVFKGIWKNGGNKEVFTELAFCLLTPQSKARGAEKAINALLANGKLFDGTSEEIREELNVVRFKNKKAEYIVEAREKFSENGEIIFKDIIEKKLKDGVITTRDWIVKDIKGIGYKEAGHFLRNIGFGEEVAILDRHILKNLKRFEVIEEIPSSITPKIYHEIEEKMVAFSAKINIPMDHLDFLFWYNEAGEVFK